MVCRESQHAVVLTLAILVSLLYFIGFPTLVCYKSHKKAKEIVTSYVLDPFQPLFLERNRPSLRQRLERDERFEREDITRPVVSGVYTVGRADWKWVDVGLLLWISALSQLFDPTFWTAGLQLGGIGLYGIGLVLYVPYKSETRFLFGSRVLVFASSATNILLSVIPGAAKSTFADMFLVVMLGLSFLVLVVAYFASLVAGAKWEISERVRKLRVLQLLKEAWREATPDMKRFAVQAACKKHQIDCLDVYYELGKVQGEDVGFLQSLNDCAKHFVYMPDMTFVQEVRVEKSAEHMKRLSGYTDTRFLFGPQHVKRR
jgi:hypothetical protein